MKSRTNNFIAALMALIFLTATAQAQTTAFSYQGRLIDAGSPANANYDFEFLLFDSLAGGTQLGSTLSRNSVAAANGTFGVTLDFGGQFPGANRFLEIRVRPTGSGAFTPLTPRQPVNSSPYSVQSLNAANATNAVSATNAVNATNATNAVNATTAATATDATQLNGQPAAFYQNASNIDSGTLDPTRLPVPLTLSGTSATHIIQASNESTFANTTAIRGVISSSSPGASSAAVRGQNNGTAGSGIGVWGSQDGSGFGVYGASANGTGVYGLASSATGTNYGVFGQSNSSTGRGVEGYAPATSGTNFGVVGRSDSIHGYGVSGLATADTGTTFGVSGLSNSPTGRGVDGFVTDGSGTNYGVIGSSFSSSGFGVYATGRFGATGTKAFRIDHPDDPANKYLLHYAAESPEVINFYSGKVTLDGAGQAVVELPHYFGKINQDPRYTLTAVGAPMPMLHVAAEIDEAALIAGAKAGPGEAAPVCSFRIAGGAPGAKVSWRVEAIRNDRWIQKSGAPVEVEKQGLERGTYQHPELYGQPAEKRMNYDAEREREKLPEPVRRP